MNPATARLQQQAAQRRSARQGFAPMAVMRGIRNDLVETKERMIVQAFEAGYATAEHWDHLADMQGLLILAGCTSAKRKPAADYARNVFGPTLQGIKERYLRTGKFGCNAEELKVLRGFVSKYRDFWLRQPTELLVAAAQELQAHHNRVIAARREDGKRTA